MSARARNILLAAAALLIAAAVLLSLDVARNDPLADLARELNAYGYSFDAEDFYVLGGAEDASIREVLEDSGAGLAPAVAASREAGFPSNVGAAGDITVLLASAEKGVVTIYLRDGEIELCFLQTEDGEILPIQ